MKKAIIFDLDGTLVDTLASFGYSANRAIGDFGFPPYDNERFKYFVGDGQSQLIKRMLTEAGDTKLVYFERVLEKYKEYFKEGCLHGITIYDGITELLRELLDRNLKLFVFSNKPHERTLDVIDKLFGAGIFVDIQGQCEELPRKPDPKGALQMLQKHGIKIEDCLYVGDTGTDMITGNTAGIFTIGVLWGFRDEQELRENHADAIIKQPLQILEYLNA